MISIMKHAEKIMNFINSLGFFSEKMSEITKQLLESYDFEDVRSR